MALSLISKLLWNSNLVFNLCHFQEWIVSEIYRKIKFYLCMQSNLELNSFQNLERRCVTSSNKTCVWEESTVPSGTFWVTNRLSVSIGWGDCARRETSVNFCMNTTWARCPSVIFIRSLVSQLQVTEYRFRDIMNTSDSNDVSMLYWIHIFKQ